MLISLYVVGLLGNQGKECCLQVCDGHFYDQDLFYCIFPLLFTFKISPTAKPRQSRPLPT